MAVKIVIRRNIAKEKEKEVLPLLLEIRALATSQPGYISGETLKNMEKPEQYLVISTWESADSWKAWFSSRQRTEIQQKIDSLLGEKTDYNIYLYG